MGLSDREYYQSQPRGYTMRRPSSVVVTLILVNVAFYLANGLLTPNNTLTSIMALNATSIYHPIEWFKFLTAGFAHAPWPNWGHIAGNMLALFFLGRDIEERYGRGEFLRFYLITIVLGGIIFCVVNLATGNSGASCIGASGGVVGVVVLYAMNFPRRTLLLWGILPMPAWMLGGLCVLMDLFGATQGNTGIAHSVHLTGAAFAFLYCHFGWNFGRLGSGFASMFRGRSGPKLRVHDPDREEYERNRRSVEDDAAHEAAVDAVLRKYSEQGPESLTRREQKILKDASDHYKKKHQDN